MVRNRYSLKYAPNGSRIQADIGNTCGPPTTVATASQACGKLP